MLIGFCGDTRLEKFEYCVHLYLGRSTTWMVSAALFIFVYQRQVRKSDKVACKFAEKGLKATSMNVYPL